MRAGARNTVCCDAAKERPSPLDPPKNEFASLTSRSIGRGAVAPSQTLPMRFATDSNHGNGRQHDYRKPKRRSPERTRTVGNHGEGQQQPTRKTPAGKRGTAIPFDFPLEVVFEMLQRYEEARKDRSVRVVARTRLFKSDKAAYPNRFGAFRPARIQSSSKPSAPMPLESPRRPFSGVFGLGRYFLPSFTRRAL